jgi:N-acetylated-alpha-linked acidic dipeptidase
MYRSYIRIMFAVFLCAAVSAQATNGPALMGFTAEGSQAERAAEAKFDSFLKADDLREWMRRLSARPHHLGSAYQHENAEFIASLLRSWGYKAEIERFDVLSPTPKTRLVEMTAPERFKLQLEEPPVAGDSTSGQKSEQLPTFNAFSSDGDVTAPLVYVNYGIPADYEELERHGIDVKGKIVITRYGAAYRGIKPKVAAEHGAVGCIIYSDPRNDGFYQGDVYPAGAWRNANGVQRGSVLDLALPGDPLTKGVGATKDAKRIDRRDATSITKIPVLPISYGDALPLLKNLDGAVVPDAWRGALPITYHFGGGSPTVHLKLEFNWNTVPAYDVIGRLTGSERPDEWIIRGNHYDGWVNGAEDPLSGQVAMLAEAKGIGDLAKTGWRPKRTIVFCSWDGEEEGLMGSTEWVEAHADELAKKAAVYINSDGNGRGFLGVGGSHTLEKFINEVARDVPDPQVKMSVWERSRAQQVVTGSAAQRADALSRTDLRISALGSGSDFTPFLQHMGIASINVGFGGENGGGSYHSIYDSFDHFNRFIDPGYQYGLTLSKVCGHSVLRLANADTLPFEFVNFTDTMGQYVAEVTKLVDTMREDTKRMNDLISNGWWLAVQDPKLTNVAPALKDPVPSLDLSPLQNALTKLRASTSNYQAKAKGPLSPAKQKELDETLIDTERALTYSGGLPRRDWFKHEIYAPGLYTGYGVKTLPGVREAIEQWNWTEAAHQIALAAGAIEKFAAEIDRAANVY